MPFKEIHHTADWSLHVWAEDLPSLFIEAALGMNFLTGIEPGHGQKIQRTYETSASDSESLLVAFLSELLYLAEQEKIMFDKFKVQLAGHMLTVDMQGLPLCSIKKNIKAVTYHNMQIRRTKQGYETEVVFDV